VVRMPARVRPISAASASGGGGGVASHKVLAGVPLSVAGLPLSV
jgi:hypothetical protein